MTAAARRERVQLREIAETEPDEVIALAAFLLGHERTREAAWTCSCGHAGRLGEGFTHHQARELLALQARRRAGPTSRPDLTGLAAREAGLTVYPATDARSAGQDVAG